MAFKKLKDYKAEWQYKKKYGEDSWENRETADKFIEILSSYDKSLYSACHNSIFEYEYWIRSEMKNGQIKTREAFRVTSWDLRYLGENGCNLAKYDWVPDFPISLETLPHMIKFQLSLQELVQQNHTRLELTKEMEENGVHSLGIRSIENMMNLTIKEMERILNPVTRKFYDETSREEALAKKLAMKLKELNRKTLSTVEGTTSQEHQLESIRQLETVLENGDVSDKTKEEAKETIKKIQHSIKLEEERKRREEAEIEAQSIIQASSIVHNLTSTNPLFHTRTV